MPVGIPCSAGFYEILPVINIFMYYCGKVLVFELIQYNIDFNKEIISEEQ